MFDYQRFSAFVLASNSEMILCICSGCSRFRCRTSWSTHVDWHEIWGRPTSHGMVVIPREYMGKKGNHQGHVFCMKTQIKLVGWSFLGAFSYKTHIKPDNGHAFYMKIGGISSQVCTPQTKWPNQHLVCFLQFILHFCCSLLSCWCQFCGWRICSRISAQEQ